MTKSNAGGVRVERKVMRMVAGKRYIVTKDSNDLSFQSGNHIEICPDGSILCREAGGWMDEEDVAEATLGMEFEIDKEWAEVRRKQLLAELKELDA